MEYIMIIFYKEYDGESIADIEEDVYDAVNDSDIPADDHGFTKGIFRVTISWSEE
jgi:hypothetical protein